MPLNWRDAAKRRVGGSAVTVVRGQWLVGNVIKFPDDGRIVRFGRSGTDESATIIILPVVRIERYADSSAEEPRTNPPADSGGRRRMRRR
jgi:hypothetical protein